MTYYYNPEKYHGEKNSNGKFITRDIRNDSEEDAYKIIKSIESTVKKITHSTKKLDKHWNGVNTFGWIFVDYEVPDDAYWNIIGSGHLDLFKIIKNDYSYLVLSKTMPHNTRNFDHGEYKVLIINIDYFRKFSRAITKKNFVNLFMYKFDNIETEKIIRSWLLEKPDKLQIITKADNVSISDIATILEKYEITSLHTLSEFLDNAGKILKSRIEENFDLFNKKLNEFEVMMDEEKDLQMDQGKISNLENRLKSHLKENPWIIDFMYNEKDVDEKTHRYVDVLVVGSYLSYKKGLIIELKRPDAPTIKQYRDRDAITATVGNAISQLIQYTKEIFEETIKENDKTFFEGLIIIGNDMNDFLPFFNQFLHNVSVKTYREIHSDARKRLDTFADGPKQSVISDAKNQSVKVEG